MRIIDTTTFFDESMMMDIRFNILDPYVDKFIVCESLFSHSGKKKKINFELKNYPKFKNKIIHIILDKEPENLIKKKNLSPQEKRLNSIYRIKEQRNYIKTVLNQFSSEDYIIYSDNDEIPNLEKFDLKLSKKKYIIFNQKLFYYKLNLGITKTKWFGSKACKLKYLKSVDLLRNIKNKKYSFFRLDSFFKENKQNSVEIINDGGWHFSNLKTLEQLEKKYLNDENHAEYETQNNSVSKIKNYIERKVVPYNHQAKKDAHDRFNETALEKIDISFLPKYIIKNLDKYKEWIIE
jgi:beta-1,4-mannosyl-glycoprotein beta-1,4-N-acetylglucosaminyltransferase